MILRFIMTPKINLANYQGDQLKNILNSHFSYNIQNAEIGKVIQIKIDENDKAKAREIATSLMKNILVNDDVEDCIYELLEEIKV